jgi:DNA modification methylase
MQDLDILRAKLGDKAKRIEQIGGQVLIQGDCREIIGGLSFDAICTDPPYGIGADAGVGKYGRIKAGLQRWDSAAPDVSWMSEHLAIVWGGNYFGLPASRAYLVWDKGAGFKGRDFAECEMAWCSFDANARIFARDPLAKGDYRGKQHPTQKPVALMEWCLGFLPNAQTILDPFMGSGTTLVACQNLDRNGIGIELDPDYFEIACKRVDEATRQPRLFSEPTPKPTQDAMDL